MDDRMMEKLKLRRATLARLGVAAVAVASILGVAACGGSDSEGSSDGGGNVSLVAYSTPQELYEESIEPAYNETSDGEGVTFENSFGASGDQSRAVESGLPADVVHLPLEPDMQRLVDAGIIAEDYNDGDKANVQNSVVVFTVREGNPENIQDWDDLVTGDVEVITPNPFTSGGARWNIMAAYGAQLNNGASEEEALEYVRQLLENTPVQDKAASDALATFTGGKGDVLLSYENEAIRAQEAGEDVEYVIPDDTILIETQIALSEDAENPEGGQAFIDYLFSPEGQKLFAEGGYRPVDEKVFDEFSKEFPEPPGLFTIEEFGGWDTVATEFFDPENGSIAEVERSLGVATE
jgi:sulfate/thiosulfate transport system substrate-binding protein